MRLKIIIFLLCGDKSLAHERMQHRLANTGSIRTDAIFVLILIHNLIDVQVFRE